MSIAVLGEINESADWEKFDFDLSTGDEPGEVAASGTA
jgi:hypothetical protein